MLSVARRPSPVASPVAVAGPWNALACDARADAASAAMQKRSVMHGLCKLLRSLGFFKEHPDPDLFLLARRLEFRWLRPGEPAFRRGAAADDAASGGCYYLLHGSCHVRNFAGAAVHCKTDPDESFMALLPLIDKYAGDDRNFVKKAVNWALRNIGMRNRTCHQAALALAENLAGSDDRTRRWVGRDAVKYLSEPKRLARLKP